MNRISLAIVGAIAILPAAAWAAPQTCATGTIISIGNAPTINQNGWTIIVKESMDQKTLNSDGNNTINFDTAKGQAVFGLGVSGYLSGATAVVTDNQGRGCASFDQIVLQ